MTKNDQLAIDLHQVKQALPQEKEPLLALSSIADALVQRAKLEIACAEALAWLESMQIVRGGKREKLWRKLTEALQ